MTTRLLAAALLLFVAAASACVTWRSKLRSGSYAEACALADQLEDDGMSRAALQRISREYTATTDTSAHVSVVDELDELADLDQRLDRDQWRVVELRTSGDVVLRAAVMDDHVWVPATPEDVRAALARAAGLELARRPSPVAQSAAEATDRQMRKLSKGLVDPKLRTRPFGVVPTCPAGVGDCKARRETFRVLDRRFAADPCDGGECRRLYVLQKRWESLAEPGARLEVRWNLEQCPVSHLVDVPLEASVGADTLRQDWMRAAPELTFCTLEYFAPRGCTATVPGTR